MSPSVQAGWGREAQGRMNAMKARCRRCGGHVLTGGEPHELRIVVFEEAAPAQEEVLRLCGRCKVGFRSDLERDQYLEAAVLA